MEDVELRSATLFVMQMAHMGVAAHNTGTFLGSDDDCLESVTN